VGEEGGENDKWVPRVGSWDEGEIYKMMNAGEVDIKE
jgi:hypothetical protein